MIPPESFLLDSAAPGTLQARIRAMVASGILTGRFRPGERLPSSRKLAQHLGVSRITVTLAYTELVADDYLTARGRSGYFVSQSAPEPPAFAPAAPAVSSVDWAQVLGPTTMPALGVQRPTDWAQYRYNFIYGQPDPQLADTANWRLCALQALGRRDFEALAADQYDRDDPELVEFIARQILPKRGILAAHDEILVTLGAQNGLWLTANTLLKPGKISAIEDPGYPALRAILARTGAAVCPVPVGANGLPPENIPTGTDVVFATPSHQCPTATTMPLAQRKALLARAEDEGFLVVEDDYDLEMTYNSGSITASSPALKSLDKTGRVIYVGSFSKSIFPGLRLGFLAGPAPFIAAARALRADVLRHPPGLIQRAAAYYLRLGHYDALLRRTARAYAERRVTMARAVAAHGLVEAGNPGGGGSSIWLRAPGRDMQELATSLRDQSVLIEYGAPFFAGTADANLATGIVPQEHFRLAFSSLPASRIDEGIRLVAQAING